MDTSLLVRISVALAVFIIFYGLSGMYRNYLINKWVTSSNLSSANLFYYYVSNLIYYSMILSGLSISLYVLQLMPAVNITIIGSMGALLWLIGNNMLSLYTSGMLIISNDLFTIGKRLTIRKDINTVIVKGTVIDFNLTHTKLKVNNSDILIVPNNIINSNIINVE